MASRRTPTTGTVSNLPTQPFFHTTEQRVMLARQRFFEEGTRPSGLVSESVIQSWTRCVGSRRHPGEAIVFDPVGRSRVSAVLARNHALLEVADEELRRLDSILAGTAVKAMLTDRHGVVVRTTPVARHETGLLSTTCRVGVDLGELHIGTAAPGVAAQTRRPCTVLGPEHFFAEIQAMHCAAAPIVDARGQLAGVLDITVEGQPFGFDAHSLVSMTATSIENRLLARQARELVLVRFHAHPNFLGTPMEGLAALDLTGRVAWVNHAAAGQLGLSIEDARHREAEAVLGLPLRDWLDRGLDSQPRPFKTPAGLCLWAQCRGPQAGVASSTTLPAPAPGQETPSAPPGSASAMPPLDSSAEASPPSWASASRSLIEQTLAQCEGNISRAAKRLGVSRGLLYRHLRAQRERAEQPAPSSSASD